MKEDKEAAAIYDLHEGAIEMYYGIKDAQYVWNVLGDSDSPRWRGYSEGEIQAAFESAIEQLVSAQAEYQGGMKRVARALERMKEIYG